MTTTSGHDHLAERPGGPTRSWIAHVVLACVGGIALAGMFIGLYDTLTPSGHPGLPVLQDTDPADVSTQAPQAVVYAEMKGAQFGPNANWRSPWPRASIDATAHYDAAPPDTVAREAANTQRAERRAYSGAPPVVPHAIDQTNAASCLVCHGDGLNVGQVIAPKMSHEPYPNCTQCHVESSNRALPPTSGPRVGGNEFEGLAAPGPGERAWLGAPPIIPHTTWMREDCTSCHGTLGKDGLRTSHPWRTYCVQCHAPSAELDQWQALSAERPPVINIEDPGR